MDYLIHNATRDRNNRMARSMAVRRRSLKVYLFKEQFRLVRGRPVRVPEEKLMANIDEVRAKVREGLLRVTTCDLAPFDVDRLAPVPVPTPAKPKFPLDSINRDAPSGLSITKFGDAPLPEKFEMPVELPEAAYEVSLEEPPQVAPPVAPPVEETASPLPALDSPAKSSDARPQQYFNKHHKRRR